MYYIELDFGTGNIKVPFNHLDENNDVIIERTLNEFYLCLSKTILENNNIDNIEVSFITDEKVIFQKKYSIPENITLVFENENTNFYSPLVEVINDFYQEFDKLNGYVMFLEDTGEEIVKVVLNGVEEIDLEYFINNIYKNQNGRYYRKFSTKEKLIIFEDDVVLSEN